MFNGEKITDEDLKNDDSLWENILKEVMIGIEADKIEAVIKGTVEEYVEDGWKGTMKGTVIGVAETTVNFKIEQYSNNKESVSYT